MHSMKMRFAGRRGSVALAQPGAAKTDLCRGRYARGPVLRRHAEAIAFAAGILMALAAAGHAQSPSRPWPPGDVLASLPVKERPIPMVVNHHDPRQNRSLDSDLQQLYDVIMSRVGASYPR